MSPLLPKSEFLSKHPEAPEGQTHLGVESQGRGFNVSGRWGRNFPRCTELFFGLFPISFEPENDENQGNSRRISRNVNFHGMFFVFINDINLLLGLNIKV